MSFNYSTLNTQKNMCYQFSTEYCLTLNLKLEENILQSLIETNTGYSRDRIVRLNGGYVDCGEWGGNTFYRNPVATIYKYKSRWYVSLNSKGYMDLEVNELQPLVVLRSSVQENPNLPVTTGRWQYRKVIDYAKSLQHVEWTSIKNPISYIKKCGDLDLSFGDPPIFAPDALFYASNMEQNTCNDRGFPREKMGKMYMGTGVREFVKGIKTPEKPSPVFIPPEKNEDIQDSNEAVNIILDQETIPENIETFQAKEEEEEEDKTASYPESYKIFISFLCFVFVMVILIMLCLR